MIVGLTGGIGSGKSAAANFFMDLGIDIIDADLVAKNALKKNSKGYNLFIEKFGNKYLDNKKNINRELLRKDIFSNQINKDILENIVHPIVYDEILDFIANKQSPYCVVMVPLIFETNSSKNYDRILLIDCDTDTQIARSSKRDNQSSKDINKIISKQATRDERLSIADDIILNTSSLKDLYNNVLKIHIKYLELLNNV
jgi:dephospho-CoA kinase|uniref:Dephospho-CoA kinase n=1 Tax=uncultured bacterium HF0010_16H03 TaxID=710811 RepID=E0XP93_9BACT|nr:dephospho-CoA kinase [uncultured bacterium HF0010_16H03]